MNHGNSLLLRGLCLFVLGCAHYLGQTVAHAVAHTHTAEHCIQGDGTVKIKLIYTINEISPFPGTVETIKSFGYSSASPTALGSDELGAATGYVTAYWSSNDFATQAPCQPPTAPLTQGSYQWKAGIDICNLYTNTYCTRPVVCNAGIYYRRFTIRVQGQSSLSSGYLAPGGCYTFPEVCAPDKSWLQIFYNDVIETPDGFQTDSEHELETPPQNWTTNSPTSGPTTTNRVNIPGPVFDGNDTNNQRIDYRVQTNLATEGTMKSGFDALYKATTEGFTTLNDTLGKGVSTLNTNLSSIGNGFASGNITARGSSNTLAGISNLIAAGQYERNSNNIYGVRQNTSNTVELLRNMTNYLESLTRTNVASVESLLALATTAASDGQGSFDSMMNVVPGVPSLPADVGDWTMQIGTITADFNPLQGQFASVAQTIRAVALWCLSILYLTGIIKLTLDFVRTGASAEQARSNMTVPGAGSGIAVVMATAITVALGAIPAFAAVYIGSGVFTSLASNPFTSGNTGIVMGVSLANAYWPVAETILFAVSYVTFMLTVGLIYWVATTTVRFLVGCFIGAALVGSVSSFDTVTLKNNSSMAGIRIGLTTSGTIAPAQVYSLILGDEVKLTDFSGGAIPGWVWWGPGIAQMTNRLDLSGSLNTDLDNIIFSFSNQTNSALVFTITQRKSDWQLMMDGFEFALIVLGFGLAIRTVKKIGGQTTETI